MDQQEMAIESRSETEALPSADARLVERVRRGDVDAVHRFFDDHYPGIYRYLLWLTERPELAEDLTQETFIRAWRALDRFDPRLPLRPWLHQIARREFLRALRSRHIPLSLDAMPEPDAPQETNWTDAVEVREAVRKLPREEREMVVLHYLQGYNSAEIAQLADAQLDAAEMADGARECWGLKEWDLARARSLRPHLRFLAALTREQRWEALRPEGLPFTWMSLPQQQHFLSLLLGGQADTVKVELEDLAHATLQVRYYVPHGLQWEAPEQPNGPPRLAPRPAVDAGWAQRVLAAARRRDDQRPEAEIVAGMQPEPDLEFIYLIGTQKERPIRRWVHVTGGNSNVP